MDDIAKFGTTSATMEAAGRVSPWLANLFRLSLISAADAQRVDADADARNPETCHVHVAANPKPKPRFGTSVFAGSTG